jgi:hypothetical protein
MVAPRNLRWLLHFWKICAPLLHNTCWLGWNILAVRKVSSKQSRCLSAVVRYIHRLCKACEFYRDTWHCILLEVSALCLDLIQTQSKRYIMKWTLLCDTGRYSLNACCLLRFMNRLYLGIVHLSSNSCGLWFSVCHLILLSLPK